MAGPQPAPVPTEQQILVKYAIEVQMICSILSASADWCSRGTGGSRRQDVAYAVSIYRGRGTVCVKIQEPAVGTIRKEAEQ